MEELMTETLHSIEEAIAQNANEAVPDASLAPAESGDWREGLPDELKNAPSLAKFKDQASLVKSYLEGEKALSARVAIPKENATDAEWEAFYKKIGRPEDKRYRPDDLAVGGEEDEAALSRYEDLFHASGLTKKQGQAVLSRLIEASAQLEEEAKAKVEATRAQNLKTLEEAFGEKMDVNIRQIQAALGQFGGEARQELAALVEETGYNPALVQFLSRVGETFASSRLVTGESPKLPTARQAALDEIKKLEGDQAFQLQYRGNDPEQRRDAIERMRGLYRVACQTSDI
jgi:hypothetical protein